MTTAPVCHVSPTLDIQQPVASPLPSIPTPDNTLEGLLATVMALKRMVEMLAGQVPNLDILVFNRTLNRVQQVSNGNNPQKRPPNQPPRKKDQPNRVGRWNEVRTKRITKTVRVTNPNDPSQFVDVERIEAIQFQDSVTGEGWMWTR